MRRKREKFSAPLYDVYYQKTGLLLILPLSFYSLIYQLFTIPSVSLLAYIVGGVFHVQ